MTRSHPVEPAFRTKLAVLPINDAVVFPLMTVPLLLNDPNLLRLADEALADRKLLGPSRKRTRMRPSRALRCLQVRDGRSYTKDDSISKRRNAASRAGCRED